MSKASRNRDIARAKIVQQRAEEARRTKRRNLLVGLGAVALAIIAAVVVVIAATSGGGASAGGNPGAGGKPALKLVALSTLGTLKAAPNPGPAGPEGVPIPNAAPLAGTASDATGSKVDGIRCEATEQTLFHIHAHLAIFVNGAQRQIPALIGIPSGSSCLYWLHTHSADGIIHIESPVQHVFTLGDFFAEWGQPLGPNAVGPVSGRVTAIYNGKVYVGNPQDIPLTKHAQIQLEVGKPLVAPETVSFPNGL
ncbi:MAG TPA: hypothetical protein VF834_22180 [Streptosporangiaceae bacterium]